MSHTPGQWQLRKDTLRAIDCYDVFTVDGDYIASCAAGVDAKDNGLVIAAAPDLLAALKAVVAMLQKEAPGTKLNGRTFDQLGIDAHNAIAKAEGR